MTVSPDDALTAQQLDNSSGNFKDGTWQSIKKVLQSVSKTVKMIGHEIKEEESSQLFNLTTYDKGMLSMGAKPWNK